MLVKHIDGTFASDDSVSGGGVCVNRTVQRNGQDLWWCRQRIFRCICTWFNCRDVSKKPGMYCLVVIRVRVISWIHTWWTNKKLLVMHFFYVTNSERIKNLLLDERFYGQWFNKQIRSCTVLDWGSRENIWGRHRWRNYFSYFFFGLV